MKTHFLLAFFTISVTVQAQSWNITGNQGTNPSVNYLGTNDNSDFIIKTNNAERIRVGSLGSTAIGGLIDNNIQLKIYGRTQVKSDIDGDALAVLNDSENVDPGRDLLFLRYGKYQPNNPSVMTVSGMTSPTKYEAFFNLKSNGKLGLGTFNYLNCTDCSDYRLFVKDGIRTEKVKVDVASVNGWADYVFKNDYQLKSLEEVEKYISEKGHLPNIPSAKQIVKEGLNLGEMDAKLLEKIEELTLYTIEQNKQLREQSERIKKLEEQLSSKN